MNHFGADYLAARFSVWDLGLSRLALLRPVAGYRAWQESRRALRDSARLDAHLRAETIETLRKVSDVERLANRVVTGHAVPGAECDCQNPQVF